MEGGGSWGFGAQFCPAGAAQPRAAVAASTTAEARNFLRRPWNRLPCSENKTPRHSAVPDRGESCKIHQTQGSQHRKAMLFGLPNRISARCYRRMLGFPPVSIETGKRSS